MKNDTGIIVQKRISTWVHPDAHAALKEVVGSIKMAGLTPIGQQDHVTLALLHYAKTIKHKKIQDGDDIAVKLNLT